MDRVLATLRPVIGDQLTGVTYWGLNHEITAADQIEDPQFYTGGEVELRLLENGQVYVGWDENAGWPHHFSLQVQASSTFLPGALVPWPADEVTGWASLVGSRISSAEILGHDSVPHVLALGLGAMTAYIGDGSEQSFCDGDDVLVRIGDSDPQLRRLTTLWTSQSSASS
jgi:hypothetical protein